MKTEDMLALDDTMTLRDYFAARALLSVAARTLKDEGIRPTSLAIKEIGDLSYIIADAMLEARKR